MGQIPQPPPTLTRSYGPNTGLKFRKALNTKSFPLRTTVLQSPLSARRHHNSVTSTDTSFNLHLSRVWKSQTVPLDMQRLSYGI